MQHPLAPVRRVPGIRESAKWTPTTSCPASTARAAATALSTPPLIAAKTFTPTSVGSASGKKPQAPALAARGHPRGSSLLDNAGEYRRDSLDVILCGVVAQTKAQCSACRLFAQPHRQENVRGFGNTGLAGGPGGDLNTVLVQQVEQHVPLTAGNRDVQVARKSRIVGPAHHHIGNSSTQLLTQGISPGGQMRTVLDPSLLTQLQGSSKSNNTRNIEGSRAPQLLVSAVHQRTELRCVAGQD